MDTNNNKTSNVGTPKPAWLKKRIRNGKTFQKVRAILKESGLNTVCDKALCPNIGDCFSRGTSTFLILGNLCTRDCRFCNVAHQPTSPPDPEEPLKVAEAVKKLGLKYIVITSVTRDDLPDGGAGHFAETIEMIRTLSPGIVIEVLIPDFKGCEKALQAVVDKKPDVIGHNLETVPRLYPSVRPGADYNRSLNFLKKINDIDPEISVKSGIMMGLGEEQEEVLDVLTDLSNAQCSLLWLGQYLQPDKSRLPVHRFVPPDEFDEWREKAQNMGFQGIASGPLVRSSFLADELYGSLKE